MQSLLFECTRPGYPPDYLLSRIRGRLEELDSGMHVENADDKVIWDSTSKSRRWIYQQMDYTLRQTLVPLFVYFEIHTLILCLRVTVLHQSDIRMIDFEQSLLAERVKRIFSSFATPEDAIGKLEKFMGNSGLSVDGLVSAYEEGGVQRCEECIRRRFFEHVFSFTHHPEVIGFFRRIIDLKNIVTMAKCLRWKVDPAPEWINGGHLRMGNVEQFPAKASLEKMVRRFAGNSKVTDEGLHPVPLAELLHNHLSNAMTRRIRSAEPVESCMAYIWLSHVAARTRSTHYHVERFAEYFSTNRESVQ